MRRICVYILLVYCGVLQALLLTGAFMVFAQNITGATPASVSMDSQKENPVDISGVDVVMLLDCSGKMKQIDPYNFRKPAAKLFIALLGEEDGVGIIGFGDSAREISPLARNSRSNREKLYSGIDNITAKEFNTNITEAVKAAFNKLKSSTRKNRVIILLSDGMLDLGSPTQNESSYNELKKLLPEIMKAGIKIHAIAFNQLAEMDLLTEIAAETNGTATLAKSDKDLHIIFTSIFEKIKSPDSLPLSGDSFYVDKSIQETILLITRMPGTHTELTDPLKQNHSHNKHGENITWYESSAFDMITVSMPAVGSWKVRLSSPEGNKIFIITDLKLKGFFDRDIAAVGDKIRVDAWLEKQGAILRDTEFLDQVLLSAEITTPERKNFKTDLVESIPSGASRSRTGIYFGEYDVRFSGDYQITIKAEGRTFKREKTFQMRTLESITAVIEKKSKADTKKKLDPYHVAIEWKPILIMFGSINLLFAGFSLLVYIICNQLIKRRTMFSLTKDKNPSPPSTQGEMQ
ncbi:MAG TPA: VWA domain-containing protein [Nitrospirota bacterium]|nr:VWA domain-containing protein [Nitrospirota bacterium]